MTETPKRAVNVCRQIEADVRCGVDGCDAESEPCVVRDDLTIQLPIGWRLVRQIGAPCDLRDDYDLVVGLASVALGHDMADPRYAAGVEASKPGQRAMAVASGELVWRSTAICPKHRIPLRTID